MINQPYTSDIYQFQAIDELCAKERQWTVCEREREGRWMVYSGGSQWLQHLRSGVDGACVTVCRVLGFLAFGNGRVS